MAVLQERQYVTIDRKRIMTEDKGRLVTAFLANSKHTANEIRKAYNRDAHVVHPPVRTEYFTPGDERGRIGHSDARVVHCGGIAGAKQ